MLTKESLKRYYNKLIVEGVIKSTVWGLIFGLSVVGMWTWWVALVLVLGISIPSSVMLYIKKYKPSFRQTAARLDSSGKGLDERVITMLELEGDDSYIANRQREDSKDKIKSITPKMMEFRLPIIRIIIMAVIAAYAVFAIVFAQVRSVQLQADLNQPKPINNVGGNESDRIDEIIEDLVDELHGIVDKYEAGGGDKKLVGELNDILYQLDRDLERYKREGRDPLEKLNLIKDAAIEIKARIKEKEDELKKEKEDKEKEMLDILKEIEEKMKDLEEVDEQLKEDMQDKIDDLKENPLDEQAMEDLKDIVDQMQLEDDGTDKETLDEIQDLLDQAQEAQDEQKELEDEQHDLDELEKEMQDAIDHADDQIQEELHTKPGDKPGDEKPDPNQPKLPNPNEGNGEKGENGKGGDLPTSGENVWDGNTPYDDPDFLKDWTDAYEKALSNPNLSDRERDQLQSYFDAIKPRQ